MPASPEAGWGGWGWGGDIPTAVLLDLRAAIKAALLCWPLISSDEHSAPALPFIFLPNGRRELGRRSSAFTAAHVNDYEAGRCRRAAETPTKPLCFCFVFLKLTRAAKRDGHRVTRGGSGRRETVLASPRTPSDESRLMVGG